MSSVRYGWKTDIKFFAECGMLGPMIAVTPIAPMPEGQHFGLSECEFHEDSL